MRVFLAFRAFPCLHFLCHQTSIVESEIEALAADDVDFGFRMFSQVTCLGGVVKLDLIQDPTRLLVEMSSAIEARSIVGVQVLLHLAATDQFRSCTEHTTGGDHHDLWPTKSATIIAAHRRHRNRAPVFDLAPEVHFFVVNGPKGGLAAA